MLDEHLCKLPPDTLREVKLTSHEELDRIQQYLLDGLAS